MKLKAGNIARLKSGGPNMTIESVARAGVVCVWFEGKRRKRDTFKAIMLEPLSTGTKKPYNPTIVLVNGKGKVVGRKKLSDF